MRWPSFADYEFAVKSAFAYSVFDPKFKGGQPGKGMSGGFSRVYPVKVGSNTFAMRCWVRDVGDAKSRYQKISEYLAQANLPYFVDFEYVPEGILVNGIKYPITRMEWANGLPLRAFITQNLQETDVFRTVATEFQKMVAALHVHNISHGDLQDGNILLNRNGAQVDIKLIDYDSVFVPALRGSPDSGIVGLPEYQHPQRIAGGGQTGEKVDYFSELVIYLSFLSLAEKPELWHRFKDRTGDGLLFSSDDFKNPNTSDIFGELGKLSAEVQALAATLKDFCAETSIERLAPLEDVLPEPPHEKCYEQGTTYLQKGQYYEATDAFSKAISLKPDFKEAYHALGFTYMMIGKLDEAKEEAENALAIDSDYEPALGLLDAIQPRLVTVDKIRGLRRQNDELQVQIDALRTENQALQTQKMDLGKQLDDARQDWQTETSDIRSEKQVLQNEIAELRTQNQGLQTEKADLGKQLDDARQHLGTETAELSRVRSGNQKLQTEVAGLRTENQGLHAETAEFQTQNSALQEEKTALQQQLDRAFRRWKTVIVVLSLICVACLIAFFVQFNTKDAADSQIEVLQQEQLQTQEQLQQSQTQVAEKDAEILGLESALQKSARREEQLRSQIRTLTNQDETDSQIEVLLQEQLQKLGNQVAEKDAEILGLESALQKSALREEQLRSQNQTLSNQNAALLEELDKARSQNRTLRDRIAALLEELGKARHPNMALIPEGRFQMGSRNGEFNEKPVHTVYVDAFYIDKYEVTNAQYKKFVDANPQWRKNRIPRAYHNGSYLSDWNVNDYPIGKGEHPVTYVSWYAAMAYAQWAGKRLPTEAEWEKAARGGAVGQRYPWGNSIDAGKANYGTNIGGTTRVGNYPANNYDLHDMAGNVREWCLDAYQGGFYKSSHRRNPLAGGTLNEVVMDFTNLKGSRVLRGGSWGIPARGLRVAARLGYVPTYAYPNVGFRCAKSVPR